MKHFIKDAGWEMLEEHVAKIKLNEIIFGAASDENFH